MARKKPTNPEKLREYRDSQRGQWTAEQSREIAKKKKRKGLPAGSRGQVELKGEARGGKAKKDPRIGSKKPIALVPEAAVNQPSETSIEIQQPKIKLAKSAPAQGGKAKSKTELRIELERLENDPRLEQLLDRVDDGHTLSDKDQQWLDTQLDRHQELMDLLELNEED